MNNVYNSMDDLLYHGDMSLDNLWEGSIFFIHALVEVFKIYQNSSVKFIHDGRIAIDGIYDNCTSEPFHEVITEYTFMSLSIVFLIIFSFLVKRVSFKKYVCGGRPGALLPMGMLDSHDYIVEFTLAFLSVSEDMYTFIFGFKSEFGQQIPIVKFFIKLAVVFILSITSYLTFAGLQNRYLIGYIFGVILSACYSYQGIMNSVTFSYCMAGNKIIPLLFTFIASYIVDMSLFVIFLYRIVKHVTGFGWKMNEKKRILSSDRKFCKRYVKMLFQEKQNIKDVEEKSKENYLDMLECGKLKDRIGDKVYREIPDFSLPPRLIIGISVGLFFAYRIFIDNIYIMTPTAWNFLKIINEKFETTHTNLSSAFKIITGNMSLYTLSEIQNSYRHIVFLYAQLLIGCLLTSIVFGFLNSIINSFFILRNYRLNFNKITKKGFSTMIDLKHAPSPCGLVLGFVRFSGYQAAYILWGILVVIFLMTILLYFFIGVFLIPLLYIDNSWSRKVLLNYGPVFIASIILNFLQTILVKNVFVKEKGELMEIDNKRAFIIFSHCAFFLNAMMGMFSCLKRILVWGFSGIICFCRIDFSSLPDYLQDCDAGYKCYIGFLYTEQYHHNPVLRYFTNVLIESRIPQIDLDVLTLSQTECLLEVNNHLDGNSGKNKMYRNKWRVAYTLLKNQTLITERRSLKRID